MYALELIAATANDNLSAVLVHFYYVPLVLLVAVYQAAKQKASEGYSFRKGSSHSDCTCCGLYLGFSFPGINRAQDETAQTNSLLIQTADNCIRTLAAKWTSRLHPSGRPIKRTTQTTVR